jgi:anti-anti-sigma factor
VRASPDGQQGAATYALVGEIDLSNADRELQRILEAAADSDGPVRVDCSEMTFIDSCGIRTLDVAHSMLRRQDRDLELSGVRPECARVLQITGLDQVITIT